ncbi:MAG: hypothetical protein A2W80_03580 [Candidatus Riflebacteria bacterium GWC2_50_8]|nr:MAG: hypothetical protein A2W80_03580 [Candidatus Riflebacteria bacterium GWC2_50_8]
MKSITNAKRRAFSFIEILFSIICLGILLVPIFNMFRQGTRATTQNRNDILAQQHASNLMSYAFFLPYDHDFLKVSAPRDTGSFQVDFAGKTLDLGMEDGQFKRTIEVSEIKPADWKYAYKIVTVIVRWQESNGLNRHVKVAGLVAK